MWIHGIVCFPEPKGAPKPKFVIFFIRTKAPSFSESTIGMRSFETGILVANVSLAFSHDFIN